MISLTRINGVRVIVNSDLIETIETTPDTVIKLTNGERLIVRETAEQLIKLVLDFRRSIRCCGCGAPAETGSDPAGYGGS